MAHPPQQQLEALVEGRLDEDQRVYVIAHLEECPQCRKDKDDLALFRQDIKPPHIEKRRRQLLVNLGLTVLFIGMTAFAWHRWMPKPADEPIDKDGIVNAALRKGTLEMPPSVLGLVGSASSDLRPEEAPRFHLKSPVDSAILSTRPEFSWEPFPEKARYTVSIFDNQHKLVDHSGPLSETSWRPTAALEVGVVYQWQVRAETMTRVYPSPGAKEPPVSFKILPADEADALKRIAYRARGDHLFLGVLYARWGVLDQAEIELAEAGPKATQLLSYLKSVRPRW